MRLRLSNEEASTSLFSALMERVKIVEAELLRTRMLPVPEAVGLTHMDASICGREIAVDAVPVM